MKPRQPQTDKLPPDQKVPKNPEKETEKETGGPSGPEPTRYGDWEKDGRCTDF